MKSLKILFISSILSLFFLLNISSAMYNNSVLDTIKPNEADIPEGYCYGIVPDFAKNMLKENPWNLDSNALNRFVHRVYPDADKNKMSAVHMTIIANKKNPYNDDIVCYIFIYKDKTSAEKEIEKLKNFVGYNNDRGIVLNRDNLAVYLLIDNTNEYRHIESISRSIQKRIDAL
ncbi:MAG: hypothetical protein WDA74_08675 [Spirochaetota bacterium]